MNPLFTPHTTTRTVFPANQAAYVLAYRILVFIVAPLLAVLAGLLAAAVWAAPVSILTRRRSSSRVATLCHSVVTVAACVVSLVGAALGTIEHAWKQQWLHMQMALCVGVAQGIDGCVNMCVRIFGVGIGVWEEIPTMPYAHMHGHAQLFYLESLRHRLPGVDPLKASDCWRTRLHPPLSRHALC